MATSHKKGEGPSLIHKWLICGQFRWQTCTLKWLHIFQCITPSFCSLKLTTNQLYMCLNHVPVSSEHVNSYFFQMQTSYFTFGFPFKILYSQSNIWSNHWHYMTVIYTALMFFDGIFKFSDTHWHWVYSSQYENQQNNQYSDPTVTTTTTDMQTNCTIFIPTLSFT